MWVRYPVCSHVQRFSSHAGYCELYRIKTRGLLPSLMIDAIFLAGISLGWAHRPTLSTFQGTAAKIPIRFFQSCNRFFFSGKLGAPCPCESEAEHTVKCRLGAPCVAFPPAGNSLLPFSSSGTPQLSPASQRLSPEPWRSHTADGGFLQLKSQIATNHTQ